VAKSTRKLQKNVKIFIFFTGAGSFFQKAHFWAKKPSLALFYSLAVQPNSA
jgi:hypothetical protein